MRQFMTEGWEEDEFKLLLTHTNVSGVDNG